jgi:DNA-binding HxlR family transcriptional regulator
MVLASEILGDRWTMRVIREAFCGVTRFDDLRTDLGAPRGILSAQLKALVTAGALERTPYREGKARVRHEYRLTPRGQELALPLTPLMEWDDRHLLDAPSPSRILSKTSGASLRVALVSPEGQAVPRQDVTYTVVNDNRT